MTDRPRLSANALFLKQLRESAKRKAPESFRPQWTTPEHPPFVGTAGQVLLPARGAVPGDSESFAERREFIAGQPTARVHTGTVLESVDVEEEIRLRALATQIQARTANPPGPQPQKPKPAPVDLSRVAPETVKALRSGSYWTTPAAQRPALPSEYAGRIDDVFQATQRGTDFKGSPPAGSVAAHRWTIQTHQGKQDVTQLRGRILKPGELPSQPDFGSVAARFSEQNLPEYTPRERAIRAGKVWERQVADALQGSQGSLLYGQSIANKIEVDKPPTKSYAWHTGEPDRFGHRKSWVDVADSIKYGGYHTESPHRRLRKIYASYDMSQIRRVEDQVKQDKITSTTAIQAMPYGAMFLRYRRDLDRLNLEADAPRAIGPGRMTKGKRVSAPDPTADQVVGLTREQAQGGDSYDAFSRTHPYYHDENVPEHLKKYYLGGQADWEAEIVRRKAAQTQWAESHRPTATYPESLRRLTAQKPLSTPDKEALVPFVRAASFSWAKEIAANTGSSYSAQTLLGLADDFGTPAGIQGSNYRGVFQRVQATLASNLEAEMVEELKPGGSLYDRRHEFMTGSQVDIDKVKTVLGRGPAFLSNPDRGVEVTDSEARMRAAEQLIVARAKSGRHLLSDDQDPLHNDLRLAIAQLEASRTEPEPRSRLRESESTEGALGADQLWKADEVGDSGDSDAFAAGMSVQGASNSARGRAAREAEQARSATFADLTRAISLVQQGTPVEYGSASYRMAETEAGPALFRSGVGSTQRYPQQNRVSAGVARDRSAVGRVVIGPVGVANDSIVAGESRAMNAQQLTRAMREARGLTSEAKLPVSSREIQAQLQQINLNRRETREYIERLQTTQSTMGSDYDLPESAYHDALPGDPDPGDDDVESGSARLQRFRSLRPEGLDPLEVLLGQSRHLTNATRINPRIREMTHTAEWGRDQAGLADIAQMVFSDREHYDVASADPYHPPTLRETLRGMSDEESYRLPIHSYDAYARGVIQPETHTVSAGMGGTRQEPILPGTDPTYTWDTMARERLMGMGAEAQAHNTRGALRPGQLRRIFGVSDTATARVFYDASQRLMDPEVTLRGALSEALASSDVGNLPRSKPREESASTTIRRMVSQGNLGPHEIRLLAPADRVDDARVFGDVITRRGNNLSDPRAYLDESDRPNIPAAKSKDPRAFGEWLYATEANMHEYVPGVGYPKGSRMAQAMASRRLLVHLGGMMNPGRAATDTPELPGEEAQNLIYTGQPSIDGKRVSGPFPGFGPDAQYLPEALGGARRHLRQLQHEGHGAMFLSAMQRMDVAEATALKAFKDLRPGVDTPEHAIYEEHQRKARKIATLPGAMAWRGEAQGDIEQAAAHYAERRLGGEYVAQMRQDYLAQRQMEAQSLKAAAANQAQLRAAGGGFVPEGMQSTVYGEMIRRLKSRFSLNPEAHPRAHNRLFQLQSKQEIALAREQAAIARQQQQQILGQATSFGLKIPKAYQQKIQGLTSFIDQGTRVEQFLNTRSEKDAMAPWLESMVNVLADKQRGKPRSQGQGLTTTNIRNRFRDRLKQGTPEQFASRMGGLIGLFDEFREVARTGESRPDQGLAFESNQVGFTPEYLRRVAGVLGTSEVNIDAAFGAAKFLTGSHSFMYGKQAQHMEHMSLAQQQGMVAAISYVPRPDALLWRDPTKPATAQGDDALIPRSQRGLGIAYRQYHKYLSDEQKAVMTGGSSRGLTSVIAGPGTGKTTALIGSTLRMINELRDQEYAPEDISNVLVNLAYTQSASREMNQRLREAKVDSYVTARTISADVLHNYKQLMQSDIGASDVLRQSTGVNLPWKTGMPTLVAASEEDRQGGGPTVATRDEMTKLLRTMSTTTSSTQFAAFQQRLGRDPVAGLQKEMERLTREGFLHGEYRRDVAQHGVINPNEHLLGQALEQLHGGYASEGRGDLSFMTSVMGRVLQKSPEAQKLFRTRETRGHADEFTDVGGVEREYLLGRYGHGLRTVGDVNQTTLSHLTGVGLNAFRAMERSWGARSIPGYRSEINPQLALKTTQRQGSVPVEAANAVTGADNLHSAALGTGFFSYTAFPDERNAEKDVELEHQVESLRALIAERPELLERGKMAFMVHQNADVTGVARQLEDLYGFSVNRDPKGHVAPLGEGAAGKIQVGNYWQSRSLTFDAAFVMRLGQGAWETEDGPAKVRQQYFKMGDQIPTAEEQAKIKETESYEGTGLQEWIDDQVRRSTDPDPLSARRVAEGKAKGFSQKLDVVNVALSRANLVFATGARPRSGLVAPVAQIEQSLRAMSEGGNTKAQKKFYTLDELMPEQAAPKQTRDQLRLAQAQVAQVQIAAQTQRNAPIGTDLTRLLPFQIPEQVAGIQARAQARAGYTRFDKLRRSLAQKPDRLLARGIHRVGASIRQAERAQQDEGLQFSAWTTPPPEDLATLLEATRGLGPMRQETPEGLQELPSHTVNWEELSTIMTQGAQGSYTTIRPPGSHDTSGAYQGGTFELKLHDPEYGITKATPIGMSITTQTADTYQHDKDERRRTGRRYGYNVGYQVGAQAQPTELFRQMGSIEVPGGSGGGPEQFDTYLGQAQGPRALRREPGYQTSGDFLFSGQIDQGHPWRRQYEQLAATAPREQLQLQAAVIGPRQRFKGTVLDFTKEKWIQQAILEANAVKEGVRTKAGGTEEAAQQAYLRRLMGSGEGGRSEGLLGQYGFAGFKGMRSQVLAAAQAGPTAIRVPAEAKEFFTSFMGASGFGGTVDQTHQGAEFTARAEEFRRQASRVGDPVIQDSSYVMALMGPQNIRALSRKSILEGTQETIQQRLASLGDQRQLRVRAGMDRGFELESAHAAAGLIERAQREATEAGTEFQSPFTLDLMLPTSPMELAKVNKMSEFDQARMHDILGAVELSGGSVSINAPKLAWDGDVLQTDMKTLRRGTAAMQLASGGRLANEVVTAGIERGDAAASYGMADALGVPVHNVRGVDLSGRPSGPRQVLPYLEAAANIEPIPAASARRGLTMGTTELRAQREAEDAVLAQRPGQQRIVQGGASPEIQALLRGMPESLPGGSAITSFRDDNFFLSNMSTAWVNYGGKRFSTSEHAFQWAKAMHGGNADLAQQIEDEHNPFEAKKLMRGYKLPQEAYESWRYEGKAVEAMQEILTSKFSDPHLQRRLRATGTRQLAEGNTWGDSFWGIPKEGTGQNILGKMLMGLRENLPPEGTSRSSSMEPVATFAMNYGHVPGRREFTPEVLATGARDTMSAIRAGVRSHTTRWNKTDIEKIQKLKPDDIVRFQGAGDDTMLARVKALESGAVGYKIDPRDLTERTGDRWLNRWSKLEGWTPEHGREMFAKQGTAWGFQYEMIPEGTEETPGAQQLPLALPTSETTPWAIQYKEGNAIQAARENTPDDPRVLAHVVNDVPAWGAGFAKNLSETFPQTREKYMKWMREKQPALGSVSLNRPENRMYVANMLAQHGLRGKNNQVPLDYEALEQSLSTVAGWAKEQGASVHMPRIGAGLAGGNWKQIEQIIGRTLGAAGVPTTVYDLPKEATKAPPVIPTSEIGATAPGGPPPPAAPAQPKTPPASRLPQTAAGARAPPMDYIARYMAEMKRTLSPGAGKAVQGMYVVGAEEARTAERQFTGKPGTGALRGWEAEAPRGAYTDPYMGHAFIRDRSAEGAAGLAGMASTAFHETGHAVFKQLLQQHGKAVLPDLYPAMQRAQEAGTLPRLHSAYMVNKDRQLQEYAARAFAEGYGLPDEASPQSIRRDSPEFFQSLVGAFQQAGHFIDAQGQTQLAPMMQSPEELQARMEQLGTLPFTQRDLPKDRHKGMIPLLGGKPIVDADMQAMAAQHDRETPSGYDDDGFGQMQAEYNASTGGQGLGAQDPYAHEDAFAGMDMQGGPQPPPPPRSAAGGTPPPPPSGPPPVLPPPDAYDDDDDAFDPDSHGPSIDRVRMSSKDFESFVTAGAGSPEQHFFQSVGSIDQGAITLGNLSAARSVSDPEAIRQAEASGGIYAVAQSAAGSAATFGATGAGILAGQERLGIAYDPQTHLAVARYSGHEFPLSIQGPKGEVPAAEYLKGMKVSPVDQAGTRVPGQRAVDPVAEHPMRAAALKAMGLVAGDKYQKAVSEVPLTGAHGVIAPAGSGKTRTLMAIMGRLMTEKGLSPRQIRLATFSQKGRDEFSAKLATAYGSRISDEMKTAGTSGTWNALAHQILRRTRDDQPEVLEQIAGISKGFKLVGSRSFATDSYYDRLRADPRTKLRESEWKPGEDVSVMRDVFRRMKDQLDPNVLANIRASAKEQFSTGKHTKEYMMLDASNSNTGNTVNDTTVARYLQDQADAATISGAYWGHELTASLEAQQRAGVNIGAQQIAEGQLIAGYRESLVKSNRIDQEGMILAATRAMEDPRNTRVSSEFRQSSRALLVDEAQDNSLNIERLLSSLHPEFLMKVGDPRQDIFGWRGSLGERAIREGIPEESVKALRTNYRSGWGLVNFQNAAFGTETEARPGAQKGTLSFTHFDTQKEEIAHIADQMVERLKGLKDPQDAAKMAALMPTNKSRDDLIAMIQQRVDASGMDFTAKARIDESDLERRALKEVKRIHGSSYAFAEDITDAKERKTYAGAFDTFQRDYASIVGPEVMTLDTSKGGEWDTVYSAGWGQGAGQLYGPHVLNGGDEEYQNYENRAYTAISRAGSELHLTGAGKMLSGSGPGTVLDPFLRKDASTDHLWQLNQSVMGTGPGTPGHAAGAPATVPAVPPVAMAPAAPASMDPDEARILNESLKAQGLVEAPAGHQGASFMGMVAAEDVDADTATVSAAEVQQRAQAAGGQAAPKIRAQRRERLGGRSAPSLGDRLRRPPPAPPKGMTPPPPPPAGSMEPTQLGLPIYASEARPKPSRRSQAQTRANRAALTLKPRSRAPKRTLTPAELTTIWDAAPRLTAQDLQLMQDHPEAAALVGAGDPQALQSWGITSAAVTDLAHLDLLGALPPPPPPPRTLTTEEREFLKNTPHIGEKTLGAIDAHPAAIGLIGSRNVEALQSQGIALRQAAILAELEFPTEEVPKSEGPRQKRKTQRAHQRASLGPPNLPKTAAPVAPGGTPPPRPPRDHSRVAFGKRDPRRVPPLQESTYEQTPMGAFAHPWDAPSPEELAAEQDQRTSWGIAPAPRPGIGATVDRDLDLLRGAQRPVPRDLHTLAALPADLRSRPFPKESRLGGMARRVSHFALGALAGYLDVAQPRQDGSLRADDVRLEERSMALRPRAHGVEDQLQQRLREVTGGRSLPVRLDDESLKGVGQAFSEAYQRVQRMSPQERDELYQDLAKRRDQASPVVGRAAATVAHERGELGRLSQLVGRDVAYLSAHNLPPEAFQGGSATPAGPFAGGGAPPDRPSAHAGAGGGGGEDSEDKPKSRLSRAWSAAQRGLQQIGHVAWILGQSFQEQTNIGTRYEYEATRAGAAQGASRDAMNAQAQAVMGQVFGLSRTQAVQMGRWGGTADQQVQAGKASMLWGMDPERTYRATQEIARAYSMPGEKVTSSQVSNIVEGLYQKGSVSTPPEMLQTMQAAAMFLPGKTSKGRMNEALAMNELFASYGMDFDRGARMFLQQLAQPDLHTSMILKKVHDVGGRGQAITDLTTSGAITQEQARAAQAGRATPAVEQKITGQLNKSFTSESYWSFQQQQRSLQNQIAESPLQQAEIRVGLGQMTGDRRSTGSINQEMETRNLTLQRWMLEQQQRLLPLQETVARRGLQISQMQLDQSKIELGQRGARLGLERQSFGLERQSNQLQLQTNVLDLQMATLRRQVAPEQAALQAQKEQITYGQQMRELQFRHEEMPLRGQQIQVQAQQTEAGYRWKAQDISFQRWYDTQMYGTPGGDRSYRASLAVSKGQLDEAHDPFQREISGRTTQQQVAQAPVMGLANQEFYAGITHQLSQLQLGRTPFRAEAAYAENVVYLKKQTEFYERRMRIEDEARLHGYRMQDEQMALQKKDVEIQLKLLAIEERRITGQISDEARLLPVEKRLTTIDHTLTQAQIAQMPARTAIEEQQLGLQGAQISVAEQIKALDLAAAGQSLAAQTALMVEQQKLLNDQKVLQEAQLEEQRKRLDADLINLTDQEELNRRQGLLIAITDARQQLELKLLTDMLPIMETMLAIGKLQETQKTGAFGGEYVSGGSLRDFADAIQKAAALPEGDPGRLDIAAIGGDLQAGPFAAFLRASASGEFQKNFDKTGEAVADGMPIDADIVNKGFADLVGQGGTNAEAIKAAKEDAQISQNEVAKATIDANIAMEQFAGWMGVIEEKALGLAGQNSGVLAKGAEFAQVAGAVMGFITAVGSLFTIGKLGSMLQLTGALAKNIGTIGAFDGVAIGGQLAALGTGLTTIATLVTGALGAVGVAILAAQAAGLDWGALMRGEGIKLTKGSFGDKLQNQVTGYTPEKGYPTILKPSDERFINDLTRKGLGPGLEVAMFQDTNLNRAQVGARRVARRLLAENEEQARNANNWSSEDEANTRFQDWVNKDPTRLKLYQEWQTKERLTAGQAGLALHEHPPIVPAPPPIVDPSTSAGVPGTAPQDQGPDPKTLQYQQESTALLSDWISSGEGMGEEQRTALTKLYIEALTATGISKDQLAALKALKQSYDTTPTLLAPESINALTVAIMAGSPAALPPDLTGGGSGSGVGTGLPGRPIVPGSVDPAANKYFVKEAQDNRRLALGTLSGMISATGPKAVGAADREDALKLFFAVKESGGITKEQLLEIQKLQQEFSKSGNLNNLAMRQSTKEIRGIQSAVGDTTVAVQQVDTSVTQVSSDVGNQTSQLGAQIAGLDKTLTQGLQVLTKQLGGTKSTVQDVRLVDMTRVAFNGFKNAVSDALLHVPTTGDPAKELPSTDTKGRPIPRDIGIDFVPEDQVTKLHRGEAVLSGTIAAEYRQFKVQHGATGFEHVAQTTVRGAGSLESQLDAWGRHEATNERHTMVSKGIQGNTKNSEIQLNLGGVTIHQQVDASGRVDLEEVKRKLGAELTESIVAKIVELLERVKRR